MVTCADASVLWHKAEHSPVSTVEVKSVGLKLLCRYKFWEKYSYGSWTVFMI
jgi:hypothetical protein